MDAATMSECCLMYSSYNIICIILHDEYVCLIVMSYYFLILLQKKNLHFRKSCNYNSNICSICILYRDPIMFRSVTNFILF